MENWKHLLKIGYLPTGKKVAQGKCMSDMGKCQFLIFKSVPVSLSLLMCVNEITETASLSWFCSAIKKLKDILILCQTYAKMFMENHIEKQFPGTNDPRANIAKHHCIFFPTVRKLSKEYLWNKAHKTPINLSKSFWQLVPPKTEVTWSHDKEITWLGGVPYLALTALCSISRSQDVKL